LFCRRDCQLHHHHHHHQQLQQQLLLLPHHPLLLLRCLLLHRLLLQQQRHCAASPACAAAAAVAAALLLLKLLLLPAPVQLSIAARQLPADTKRQDSSEQMNERATRGVFTVREGCVTEGRQQQPAGKEQQTSEAQ
jgi:hypothetical protein